MDAWSDAQIVSLEGQGVKAFLQGYLTCNSERIEQNAPTPMTLCNLKGRVISNGWAIGDDERVLLVVHHTVAEALAAFLAPYAVFSKCKIITHNAPVAVVAGKRNSAAFTNHWCFANDLLNTPQADGHDQSSAIAQDLVANRFAWVSDRVAGKFLPQVLGLHEAGAVDREGAIGARREVDVRHAGAHALVHRRPRMRRKPRHTHHKTV